MACCTVFTSHTASSYTTALHLAAVFQPPAAMATAALLWV